MKPFHKKLLFLEGVLLYVILILAVTNKDAFSWENSHMVPNGVMTLGKKTISNASQSGVSRVSEPSVTTDNDRDKPVNPYKELEKKVALTFDDGPDSQYTPMLLDGLKERNVRATFFVLGKQAEKYPDLIERMEKEGHLIGNHTYSHLQLSERNRERFQEELTKTSGIIEKITGNPVQYVRPPYGTWDKALEKELHMFPVLWDIDPLDWCRRDTECMVQNIVNEMGEDAIILMHDQYESTVTAALKLVDVLKKQGYEFVTVDELLEN